MPKSTWTGWIVVGSLAAALGACGGDDEGDTGGDDTPPPADAAPVIDAAPTPDAAPPMPTAARGQYLVDHVAGCGDCHTPRDMMGAPIAAQYLAGIDCFVDVDPMDNMVGCLSSRNLTNHATGLMNFTDEEIKDMFVGGVRPNGDVLHSFMPYYVWAAMTEVDQDSIVLHLRATTGVDHTVQANQPPWTMRPPAAKPPIGAAHMPEPTPSNEATLRGRYLATLACMDCHTPRTDAMDSASFDTTKMYAGGYDFPSALLGLPPVFPAIITSRNLTPHAMTGVGYSKAELTTLLDTGVTKAMDVPCPPMPGPMANFAGLTDQDVSDIADYLLALPAVDNMTGDCTPPMMGP